MAWRREAMIARLSVQRKAAIGVGFGLLLLAQAGSAPSDNLGVPTVPGTRTPESNPATAATLPTYRGPPAATPGAGSVNSGTDTPPPAAPGSTSGPAYSFGAATPPIGPPGAAR